MDTGKGMYDADGRMGDGSGADGFWLGFRGEAPEAKRFSYFQGRKCS